MMDLSLHARTALPAELRLLAARHPRPSWSDLGPLTRYWLDRHAMFRRVGTLMAEEVGALASGGDPARHGAGFARLANLFLGELEMHHGIEDHHYFPRLIVLEPRLARGFEMLETDHAALHGMLGDFAADARAMLSALDAPDPRPGIERMQERLGTVTVLLDRHLDDEEDLVVPLLIERGEAGLDG